MVSVLIMDIKLKTGLVSWQFNAFGGWHETYVSDAWWMDRSLCEKRLPWPSA